MGHPHASGPLRRCSEGSSGHPQLVFSGVFLHRRHLRLPKATGQNRRSHSIRDTGGDIWNSLLEIDAPQTQIFQINVFVRGHINLTEIADLRAATFRRVHFIPFGRTPYLIRTPVAFGAEELTPAPEWL